MDSLGHTLSEIIFTVVVVLAIVGIAAEIAEYKIKKHELDKH